MKKTSKQKAFTLLVNKLNNLFVNNRLLKCAMHEKYHLLLEGDITEETMFLNDTDECYSYEFVVLSNLQFIEVINILRVKLDEEKET